MKARSWVKEKRDSSLLGFKKGKPKPHAYWDALQEFEKRGVDFFRILGKKFLATALASFP
jgi:hypothetical protein